MPKYDPSALLMRRAARPAAVFSWPVPGYPEPQTLGLRAIDTLAGFRVRERSRQLAAHYEKTPFPQIGDEQIELSEELILYAVMIEAMQTTDGPTDTPYDFVAIVRLAAALGTDAWGALISMCNDLNHEFELLMQGKSPAATESSSGSVSATSEPTRSISAA